MRVRWYVISGASCGSSGSVHAGTARTVALLGLLGAVFLGLVFCAGARAQERLFEEEPFDQITLDKSNDNAVLKVKPLDLPGRQVPEPLPWRGTLQVRLLDDPETLYEIPWRNIQKPDGVKLFERLVLEKANELVEAKRFDEAYDYFKFLQEKYPTLPGLAEAMEEYLFQEAGALYLKRRYDRALAVLRELYDRNPKRPGLDKVLGATTDKLLEQYLARQDYPAARKLLRNLADCFPEQPIVAKREDELKRQAAALLSEARKTMQNGDLRKAAQLSRRLRSIWPELPGAKQLAQSLHEKYPRVVVGVSVPAVEMEPGQLNDWAARRSGRLVYRTLTEFAGPGNEGGRYNCPVGEMTVEPLDRRITLQIQPDLGWSSGEATLTGYDVSRRLLAMADPQNTAYRVGWAELLSGVAVRDVYRVEAELRLAHVRPEALLQTILVPHAPPATTNQLPPGNGPYLVHSRTEGETCYLANPRCFALGPGQPKEIVERRYRRGAKAIQALKQGQIQVLDRVNPWSLGVVRRDRNLVLAPYAVPLVHCLIPNVRKPLTAHRAFRRALVYGIHRQVILDRLADGGNSPGGRVLSGPFPTRAFPDDPISYASDPGIEPRPYQPRLAIALAELGLKEVAAKQKKKGQSLDKMPRLVLAHPPHEIAQVACISIQRQLEAIGIPIDLQELRGAPPRQVPAGVDLLYAEVAMWEPVVDARRLLGEDGLVAGCSPYMRLALRQLEQAADWQQVRSRLHQIHRIAHDDVAVVPLWQLTDYFAYHESLQGIGARLVSLYQNVEQWQPGFQYPAR